MRFCSRAEIFFFKVGKFLRAEKRNVSAKEGMQLTKKSRLQIFDCKNGSASFHLERRRASLSKCDYLLLRLGQGKRKTLRIKVFAKPYRLWNWKWTETFLGISSATLEAQESVKSLDSAFISLEAEILFMYKHQGVKRWKGNSIIRVPPESKG